MAIINFKSIIITHWILTIWASLYDLSVTPYVFSNITMLAVGIWVISDQTSVDAIFMFVLMLLVTLFSDIILLCLFYPSSNKYSSSVTFGIVMYIINILIKPFSLIYSFQSYRDRGGEYENRFELNHCGAVNNCLPRRDGYGDIQGFNEESGLPPVCTEPIRGNRIVSNSPPQDISGN